MFEEHFIELLVLSRMSSSKCLVDAEKKQQVKQASRLRLTLAVKTSCA